MERNFIILLIITILSLSSKGFSQVVKGKIISDTGNISVIKILPDSFPNVSLIVGVTNKKGSPVWGIKKSQMSVSENGQKCEVICLDPVTNKLPINIVVVLDHSNSMISDNYSQLDQYKMFLFKDKMKLFSPLTNAKKAINQFIKQFNKKDDQLMCIGFSTKVDLITRFSNNIDFISNNISTLNEEGKTSFYDALGVGIDSLINKKGINVIVALTDGDDNSSVLTAQDIIMKSKKYDIPIYIIGLGEIKKNILESISFATHGEFFYTKSSTSLIKIYDDVAKILKSVYKAQYSSLNLAVDLQNRDIILDFDIDSLFFDSISAKYSLPYEYIQKEMDRKRQMLNILWFAGIGVSIIGSGLVIYYRIKRKKTKYV